MNERFNNSNLFTDNYLIEIFNGLLIDYNNLKELINTIGSNSEKLDNDEEKMQTFYPEPEKVKNIVVFLDDDESTTFKDSIEKDTSLKSADKVGIIRELQKYTTLSSFEISEMANHKVKSDHYTKDFLEKYRVKGLKCSGKTARVFYTRWATTIGEKLPEYPKDINIIFALSAAYGSKSEKYDINEGALKVCYDHREQIDNIVKMLNPEWNSMTNEEINQTISNIRKFISEQDNEMVELAKSLTNSKERR